MLFIMPRMSDVEGSNINFKPFFSAWTTRRRRVPLPPKAALLSFSSLVPWRPTQGRPLSAKASGLSRRRLVERPLSWPGGSRVAFVIFRIFCRARWFFVFWFWQFLFYTPHPFSIRHDVIEPNQFLRFIDAIIIPDDFDSIVFRVRTSPWYIFG